MNKRKKLVLGGICFFVLISALFYIHYSKTHIISRLVSLDGITEVVGCDNFFGIASYEKYEMDRRAAKKFISNLDKLCRREVVGPQTIGGERFSFTLIYGEEKTDAVSIYLTDKTVIIYDCRKGGVETARTFLLKEWDPNVMGQVFHPYKAKETVEK